MVSSLRFDQTNLIITPKANVAGKLALRVCFCCYHGSWNSMFNTLRQTGFGGGFHCIKAIVRNPVSYTHLTLPTIYSV